MEAAQAAHNKPAVQAALVEQVNAEKAAESQAIAEVSENHPMVKLYHAIEGGQPEPASKKPSDGWLPQKGFSDMFSRSWDKAQKEFSGKGSGAHAHHIVIKKGQGSTVAPSFQARQLLRKNGIDPYLDRKVALVWAPNWNHNEVYAKDVLRRLQMADSEGRAVVERTLREIAADFIEGRYGGNGGKDEAETEEEM